jgi:hypothetical protein
MRSLPLSDLWTKVNATACSNPESKNSFQRTPYIAIFSHRLALARQAK